MLCHGIVREAVLRTGQTVSFVGENHIGYRDLLLPHGLNDLNRFPSYSCRRAGQDVVPPRPRLSSSHSPHRAGIRKSAV